jgi:hypothetical protein
MENWREINLHPPRFDPIKITDFANEFFLIFRRIFPQSVDLKTHFKVLSNLRQFYFEGELFRSLIY